MSRPFAIVLCISLLLMAAGLVAWTMARSRQDRLRAGAHVDKRLAQLIAPGAAATSSAVKQPASVAGMVRNFTGEASQDARGWTLPAWLLGTLSPGGAMLALAVLLALTVAAGAALGGPSAVAAFLVLAALAVFGLWLRLQKRRRALVAQLPGFMDTMVRLITIGNSTHAAFQSAASTARAPLRGYMDKVGGMIAAGVELEPALLQVAHSIRIEQLVLLASVLGLGVRYGGRADVLLERMANFMRDDEQAGRELEALSAETRLSAWILGMLPLLVGGFLIVLNATYFMSMWADPTGQKMMFLAAGLQLLGVTLLYRMARLD